MPTFEDDSDDGFGGDDGSDALTECPYCGEQIYEESERCPHCEKYISQEDAPPSYKPLWILACAALALGAVLWWVWTGQ